MSNAFRIGIYGASGLGKTTLARHLIKDVKRLIVFDPMEDYGGGKGWITCHSISEVRAAVKKKWKTGFRVSFIPTVGKEPEDLNNLSWFCLKAQKNYKGNENKHPTLTLVADELNLAFPARSAKSEHNGFPNICSRGRHYGINVYGISQRVAEVHVRFRGNTSAMYILRQGDLLDIDTLARMLISTPKKALISLKNFEFIYYQGGDTKLGKVPKPKK